MRRRRRRARAIEPGQPSRLIRPDDPYRLPDKSEEDWWRFLEAAQRELPAKVRGAAFCVFPFAGGDWDAKMAVELGMFIIAGKPLIVTVAPGQQISDSLRRAADRIVEVDEHHSKESQTKLAVVMKDLMEERGMLPPKGDDE